MKKYIVKIMVDLDGSGNVLQGKELETYDEMTAFFTAAEFVKWAKEFIDYWCGGDFNDEADYILSIATVTEEEKTEEEDSTEEEDFEDFFEDFEKD